MAFLKTGTSGQEVRDLQEVLNLKIPSQPLLQVDGIFGPKTHECAVMFQKQAGLAADGVVGPLTRKALVGAVLAKMARPQT